MTTADEVVNLMRSRGGAAYFGEPVSQLEHALQTARCATRAGSPPELVLAALLHDIGHLLHYLPESVAEAGVDTRHETAGYEWIQSRFGAAVAEPVRDHVAAKRYLCRIEPDYLSRLSAASLLSLELQGGPFTADEARRFEMLPHYREALMLRQWDDEAKVANLQVPSIEEYWEILVAASHSAIRGQIAPSR
jgi:phosphonate degradation associated HDIG domain protein